jgi:uncharacterized protein (DUF1015 family)
MATIRPFRAFRPVPERAAQVASLPYDVLSTEEACESARQNPYSFLHVVKAEIDLEPGGDIHDPRVYARAHDNLYALIEDGVFVQEQRDCLYVYRESIGNKSQTGLVACTPIADYTAGKIKIHEHTRPDKVWDRVQYIEACNAHTGLILLTYRHQVQIDQTITAWVVNHASVYDFITDDSVRHTVWVIDDSETIERLRLLFESVQALYVADGHHRTEAAAQFAYQCQQHTPGATRHEACDREAWNQFLVVLFPNDQLTILDYNRVVSDLNGYSVKEFLRKASERFEIEQYSGKGPYRPDARHSFGMYLARSWYILRPKNGSYDEDDPVEALDAAILQKNLLGPVLDIHDPRTDTRIDFIGGIRGLEKLEREVDEGNSHVAFALYPTTIEEMLAVADAGKVMFPKSTWFEPKLRSGLFVHIF